MWLFNKNFPYGQPVDWEQFQIYDEYGNVTVAMRDYGKYEGPCPCCGKPIVLKVKREALTNEERAFIGFPMP